MSKLLNVSSSPHVRSKVTTQSIMYDVAIAMLPATAYGVYRFGLGALVTMIATVLACVASEYLYEKGMKKPITVSDGSALVTGMILALNMPCGLLLKQVDQGYVYQWGNVLIPMLGGVFAIIIVKQLYGGLGQNWMNPALAARCFLLISFAGKVSNFADPKALDTMAGATPLAVMRAAEAGADAAAAVDIPALVVGNITGTYGETSVIALLIGAVYLLARKVISIKIPAAYILTFAVFTFIFGGFNPAYVLAQVCAGGLIFGAFFMATDYVTSPITPTGQLVFGVVLGVLTGIFRLWGGSAEGVSYAIIISNILVPIIEKYTLPKAFGKEGK
ncbi:RnfABCDGE type electron transport complex subunit D [Lachnospiraceae bacterium 62-35]